MISGQTADNLKPLQIAVLRGSKKLEKVRLLGRAAAPKDAPSWARRRRTAPRSGAQALDVTPKLHPLSDEATGHRTAADCRMAEGQGRSPVLSICVCALRLACRPRLAAARGKVLKNRRNA